MPINVSGPNGVSVSFPDGTDAGTINDVMMKHFGGGDSKPSPITADNLIRAFADAPIIGGLANKGNAAINAALGNLFPNDETVSHKPSLGERYSENLAAENAKNEKFATEHPVASTVAGLAGGVGAGGALLKAAPIVGARLLGVTGTTLPRQMLAGGLSGAGISGVDALTRGNDPSTAALIGGGLGAAAPGAARIIGAVASPLVNNISARINPRGFAEGQVARGIAESGQSADQIANQIAQAAREGQGEFSVADALGNPGQRLLSTVARAPGEGRTEVVNFLDQRQAGQGRRVANALAEGFDAPETAEQTAARLTAERKAEANRNYGAARQAAGSVNVTPAIAEIDSTLQPGVTRLLNPQSGIADDSIEAMLRRARSLLTDGRSQVSSFPEAFRVKQEFDNIIDRATPTQQRLMIPVRNALDDQLAAASPFYRAARDRYREQSKAIESVTAGRQASMRGRFENTIPQFHGLASNAEREGFRSGYVDPLIEQAQGAAIGANKARPLTSDARRAEMQAFAPGADQLMRRVGRENTMFETRNAASGGSKTADNLADAEAMARGLEFGHNIVTGNPAGLARNALGFMMRSIAGSTPAVRHEVGRLLMMRGGTVSANDLRDILSSAVRQARARELFSRTGTAIAARLGAQQLSDQSNRPTQ